MSDCQETSAACVTYRARRRKKNHFLPIELRGHQRSLHKSGTSTRMRASVCAGEDIRCFERAISLSFRIFAAVTTAGRKAVSRFPPKLFRQYHHNRNSMTPLGTFFPFVPCGSRPCPSLSFSSREHEVSFSKDFLRTRRSVMRYSLRKTKLFSRIYYFFFDGLQYICISRCRYYIQLFGFVK